VLLPDRLKILWDAVERRERAADDATQEQDRLLAEHRSVWARALALEPGQTLEQQTFTELAAYFPGLDRAELEARCAEATSRLKAEWPEDPSRQAIERFYDENEGHIFDLMWWHTLRDDTSPLAYVNALDLARSREGRRYLDFGSGVGSGAILFARHGFAVSLADISSSLLDFARSRLARRGIEASDIDLKAAALPDHAFDFITAMDVFEHLTDPVATVDRLAAALTPGGYIFGRFAAEPDEERPQHIVFDFGPTLARFEELGFVEAWRDVWLWGHQAFQKT
jgi:2-polyprenyl-3-methyl-5-hydroxy-6-metoxy-1,4-benzoquinol methylase